MKPHFCRTRMEAALCFAAPAYSGRAIARSEGDQGDRDGIALMFEEQREVVRDDVGYKNRKEFVRDFARPVR